MRLAGNVRRAITVARVVGVGGPPVWLVLAAVLGLMAVLFMAAAFTAAHAVASLVEDEQETPSQEVPVALAAALDIPLEYLVLYVQSGVQYDSQWSILAAVGFIESNHGRLDAPGVTSGQNAHGCCAGPMQFWNNRAMAGGTTTWDKFGVDGDGDGAKDVYDPADAIPAAANYLRASGAPAASAGTLAAQEPAWRKALRVYNQSDVYVQDVWEQAAEYRQIAASADLSGEAIPIPGLTGGSGQFVFPVLGSPSFTDDFESPRAGGGHCEGRPNVHCATDLLAPTGTPIVAPFSGRLSKVGSNGLGGNRLWIEGPDNRAYLAHFDRFAPGIRDGLAVAAGTPLGTVGSTGAPHAPPHLHIAWWVRRGGAWEIVNPYPIMCALRPDLCGGVAAPGLPGGPAPPAASSGGWVRPTPGPITSGFGPRWGRMHKGIDIAAPTGTPVVATRQGNVTFAGVQGGYGNIVIVAHGGGVETAYAHLSAINVRVGQGLAGGQGLGRVGSTGNSTGPHLHFEVRIGGSAVDPAGISPLFRGG